MPLILLAAFGAAAILAEPDDSASTARQIDQLAACLEVSAPASRAACLERTARALVAAAQQERAEAARTAEAQFGKRAPRAPSPAVAHAPRVDLVEGVVTGAIATGTNRWAFSLADGSNWIIQESGLFAPPHPGQKVVIRRGSLGSYRARFEDERQPVQVQRTR